MQSVCCFSSHALINKTLSIRLILWDFGIITGEEKKINNHVYGLQDTFSIGTVSKQINEMKSATTDVWTIRREAVCAVKSTEECWPS